MYLLGWLHEWEFALLDSPVYNIKHSSFHPDILLLVSCCKIVLGQRGCQCGFKSLTKIFSCYFWLYHFPSE